MYENLIIEIITAHIYLAGVQVGRLVRFLFGLVGFLLLFSCCFLFPFGSLLYTPSVLLGTSWFFFYQYIVSYR